MPNKGLIAKLAMLSTLSLTSVVALAGVSPTASAAPQPAVHAAKAAAVKAPATQNITLTILPGAKLGPDGKMHDIYSPADFSVVQGVPVKVTVYNYDTGTHSFTASSLGVNVKIAASKKDGVAGVTSFTFTPAKTGSFTWMCDLQCDGGADGWAMSHNGYMMGTVKVVPKQAEQFVTLTIKDGVEYGPLKTTKHGSTHMHDAFSPADFTVQTGIPVHVTVVNFDGGPHSITATEIGLNKIFPGAKKDGEPSVTNFTFTVNKPGSYKWHCVMQCDGSMTSYSMTHDGYMEGVIKAVK